MNHTFDWKKFEFISHVQTALLANAMTLLALPELAAEHREMCSPVGISQRLAQAFAAAERIPCGLSAHEAARDFIAHACDSLREGVSRPAAWMMQE